MRKSVKKRSTAADFSYHDSRFESNVENCKRLRALPPISPTGTDPKLFLDRMSIIQQIRQLIFLTQASARNR